ncbi:MAG: hypothetical protein ACRDPG_10140, partial [Nocardioidaceae bacterium]
MRTDLSGSSPGSEASDTGPMEALPTGKTRTLPVHRIVTSSWPPMILTVFALCGILLVKQVPALAIFHWGIYFLFTVAIPGVFFWRLLLRSLHRDAADPPTWFEDLSLGTIFGFGVQLPIYLLGVAIGVPRFFFIIQV